MNQLAVILWGEELGRLAWDQRMHTTYFMFNPKLKNRPDVLPLIAPESAHRDTLPIYGDDRRIYHKLPPFIADSLPDSWGNKLFDQWIKDNKIAKNRITPLYKLMFMGERGMGALEFKPADVKLNYKGKINVKDLYDLSLQIYEERSDLLIPNVENITMETLIAVGTSAGGRQMKAILAFNKETGEIMSGQVSVPEGFQHYILKFEDKFLPTTEIELAYNEMAINAGIEMEECLPLEIDGISHFLTKRFDRRENEKIFMQTLAAINPEADSYEDLITTCRRLNLSEKQLIEIYRRMIFNVISNNTDDHNKNFSFLLEKNGEWEISPAYDLTFIFNNSVTSGEATRCFSVNGKVEDLTKNDLLEFAKENNIRNPEGIIQKVVDSVKKFPELARKHKIPERFSNIIQATLNKNLIELGLIKDNRNMNSIIKDGRAIKIDTIRLNAKGLYEIVFTGEAHKTKIFISPKEEIFHKIQKLEGGLLSKAESEELIANILFHHETTK